MSDVRTSKFLNYSLLFQTLYAVDHTTESLRSEWKSRGKQMVSSAKDIDWAENAAKNRWERRNVITKFMISCLNFLMGYSHVSFLLTPDFQHGQFCTDSKTCFRSCVISSLALLILFVAGC